MEIFSLNDWFKINHYIGTDRKHEQKHAKVSNFVKMYAGIYDPFFECKNNWTDIGRTDKFRFD